MDKKQEIIHQQIAALKDKLKGTRDEIDRGVIDHEIKKLERSLYELTHNLNDHTVSQVTDAPSMADHGQGRPIKAPVGARGEEKQVSRVIW